MTGIWHCKWTLTSNLALIFPALAHHHINHTSHNVDRDVCVLSNFSVLIQVNCSHHFWNRERREICHCVSLHCFALWLASTAFHSEHVLPFPYTFTTNSIWHDYFDLGHGLESCSASLLAYSCVAEVYFSVYLFSHTNFVFFHFPMQTSCYRLHHWKTNWQK